MDKFTVLQKRVRRAIGEYEKLRESLNIKDPMLSETIKRESQPFLKGHFTLAVVGEMSAGKSTFINALLGQRGLLPSAHEQTTCVLTEIIDSEEDIIEVTYADGKTKIIDSNKLKELVAIPSEYENLPINEINRYIMHGLTYNDICQKKDSLSRLQGGIEIDTSLLKEYCNTHDKSNIPTKVVVKLPLPTAYKGWKIVDTPGVGAIGGIEQATKNFINGKDDNGYNNVDAIIFVNSGRLQMQRSGFNRFVEDTFDTIYEEARRRMFLIITCAADRTFIENQEKEVNRAKNLFIDKYHLKEDRLFCVDSICSMFLEYVKDTNVDLKNLKKKTIPVDWSSEDWNASINVRDDFENMLKEDYDINNQILIENFEKHSGFGELRNKLNDFAEQEKMKLFQNLMKHINKDITNLKEQLKKKQDTLGNKLNLSNEEFKKKIGPEKRKLKKLREQKDSSLHKINEDYSRNNINNKFEEFESQILNLREEKSIYKIRNKASNLLYEIEQKKEEIHKTFINDFEYSFDNLQNSLDVTIPTIDFDSIAKKAKEKNTIKAQKRPTGRYEQKPTKGLWGVLKRLIGGWFGWGWEDDKTKEIYDYTPAKVDKTGVLEYFKENVINEFNSNLKNFTSSIRDAIKKIGDEISNKIDEKIEIQENQLERIKAEDNREALKQEYDSVRNELNLVEETLNEIKSI